MPEDRALAKRALLAIDSTAEIIQWNRTELFDFAHAVAQEQDPALFPFLDAAFLRQDGTVGVPAHALTLHEVEEGAFLYGPYGRAGAAHLAGFLKDRAVPMRVVEILTLIGSPDQVAEVVKCVGPGSDSKSVSPAVAFLMSIGGPQGRAAVLRIDAKSLDPQARQWLNEVRPQAEQMSFEGVRELIAKLGSGQVVDGEALKARLKAMYEAYGKDDTLSPLAILDSKLPKAYLIEQLEAIRSRIVYRVSDEALTDLEMTNNLINGLRYRRE